MGKTVVRGPSNGGSLGSIKKLMEQAGVPAPKGGKQWSRSTITRILADPALKGEFYCGFEKWKLTIIGNLLEGFLPSRN